ncbi:MAG TPA: glycosyltransferase family 2 protein [Isosphaeraceae bacterium]|nr:glycosyltransferase family 2 protein [Isosphaeraceae bacterium]
MSDFDLDQGMLLPPSLDLVIPVYNEEESLPALFGRLRGLLDRLVDMRVGVIFVDDHSTDRTPELLRDACLQHENFTCLRLSRNSGSHIAVLAGLAHSWADCAVFLAADLQDPPELIPKMLELWRAGNHVVWAVRERREGISKTERSLSLVFYWLMNRFGQVTFPPTGADFALLDRQVIDALQAVSGAKPSIVGAIAWLGFRQAQIPYVKEARKFGRSKWDLRKRLEAFADAFVAFSYVPMRLMSYSGITMAILGVAYAGLIIILRLFARAPIQGWSSLMVVVLVLGGAQMTMLGVLGEYLWRTLEESRKRPLYFIESRWSAAVPVSPKEHAE